MDSMHLALEQLLGMGFSDDSSRRSLEANGGNVELACNALLAEADEANAAERSESSSKTIEAPISQYDTRNGRSACTCICLEAARYLLQLFETGTATQASADSLMNVLSTGIATYEALVNAGTLTSEHTAASEVFAAVARYRETLKTATSKETFQGLLGGDTFARIFRDIDKEQESGRKRPLAIAITKPPETVVAFLPCPAPRIGPHPRENFEQWLLFDSHPRPQLGLSGASLRRFDTESALIAALVDLFPAVDLDAQDDMVASMYNMVDCTPFILKQEAANQR